MTSSSCPTATSCSRRCAPSRRSLLRRQPCRRQTATATFPAVTSDFVLRARSSKRSIRPGNLVREWDSTGDIALAETTVPICFQVPAGTGDDYLSSIHPNAIDLDLNGPGTADDQLLVSGRHNDAVYGINFDAGTVDWKLGGTTTPQSLTIVGDPLGGPKRQHDVRILPNGHITMFDNRTQLHDRVSSVRDDERAGAVRRVRHRRGGRHGHAGARDPPARRVLLRRDRQRARCSPTVGRHQLGRGPRPGVHRVRRGRPGRSSRCTCRVSTRATAR